MSTLSDGPGHGGPSDGRFSVALISMPFASVHRPSLQLGLLKAIGALSGYPVATYHFNLDFALAVGVGLYDAISEHRLPVGDWLFAETAFRRDAPNGDEFVVANRAGLTDLGGDHSGSIIDKLLEIRAETVPAYLAQMLNQVDWHSFKVVGFTSTFQQNVASLAFARALKEKYPELGILFGGANFDGQMGVEFVRSMPWIDYAISGEADAAFPALMRALVSGDSIDAIPGVVCRNGKDVISCPSVPFAALDELPTPSYDEYFERCGELGFGHNSVGGRRRVSLPFESARGCWWGAKRHCTFCGLNASTMTFRRKSAKRVEVELSEMARRYQSFHFAAVDNILDPEYFNDLFPALIGSRTSYRLFYEVKANLTRQQIELLYQAGVRWLQPGIESLSSRVLGLMRKGTRPSTNVNFLRWCLAYGIHASWNVLWGFPGERREDYDAQSDLFPLLHHLQPPGWAGKVWMERFSPLFSDRVEFPAEWVTPERSYAQIYPKHVSLERAAYFFEYGLEGTLPDHSYVDLMEKVVSWQHAWQASNRPQLRLWSTAEFVQVDDTRSGVPRAHTIEGRAAALYLGCIDRPVAVAELREALALTDASDVVEKELNQFCEQGLMMRDGGLFLALAVPGNNWAN